MSDSEDTEPKERELTRLEKLVADHYLTGLSGSDAYRATKRKCTPEEAKSRAYKLLHKPQVIAYLEKQRASAEQQFGIRKEVVIRRLNAVATGSIRSLYDEKGNLIPINELPDDAALIVGSVEVEELFEGRGNERVQVGVLRKVKLIDTNRAAENLARIMGWNRDKLEIQNDAPPPIIQLVGYDDTDDKVPAKPAAD